MTAPASAAAPVGIVRIHLAGVVAAVGSTRLWRDARTAQLVAAAATRACPTRGAPGCWTLRDGQRAGRFAFLAPRLARLRDPPLGLDPPHDLLLLLKSRELRRSMTRRSQGHGVEGRLGNCSAVESTKARCSDGSLRDRLQPWLGQPSKHGLHLKPSSTSCTWLENMLLRSRLLDQPAFL